MIPVLRAGILGAAPRRAPGFVAAYLSAASWVLPDRVLLAPEAYAAVRGRFPGLPGAREYAAGEAAADAARWPAAPAADPRPAVPPAVSGKPPASRWEVEGPRLWGIFHARPVAYAVDAAAEARWLAGFAASLRCGECRGHWLRMMREYPPDLSSPHAYARWTWQAHNAVNARLGKPPVSYADAAARWGWPADGPGV